MFSIKTYRYKIYFFILGLVSCWEAQANVWSSFHDCMGLSVPSIHDDAKSFLENIKIGTNWDREMDAQEIELKKMTNETCPNYLANPNGEENLKSFTTEYGNIVQHTYSTKMTAKSLRTFIAQKTAESENFFKQFDILFHSTLCSNAFSAAQLYMNKRESNIVKQFETLESKCPAIASFEAAKIRDRAAQQKQTTVNGTFQQVGNKERYKSSTISESEEEKKAK